MLYRRISLSDFQLYVSGTQTDHVYQLSSLSDSGSDLYRQSLSGKYFLFFPSFSCTCRAFSVRLHDHTSQFLFLSCLLCMPYPVFSPTGQPSGKTSLDSISQLCRNRYQPFHDIPAPHRAGNPGKQKRREVCFHPANFYRKSIFKHTALQPLWMRSHSDLPVLSSALPFPKTNTKQQRYSVFSCAVSSAAGF